MPLTNKRKVFVAEYLRCWNASEAARRAGYAHERSAGHALLTNPDIQAHIQEELTNLTMSADECLLRIADIAREETSQSLKALELIGKTHSLFVDRQQVEMEHSLSDKLSGQISDALARGYDDEVQD